MILGDYRGLECTLWEEIERLQEADRLTPITVVAPSRWLVRHLKLAAARRFADGLFGVHFATFFQLVRDLAGPDAPAVAESTTAEGILLDWLNGLDPEESSLGLGKVPPATYDFAGALAAAVRDLRDATLPHVADLVLERLRAAVGSADSRLTALDIRKFAALLSAYGQYTERLGRAGMIDQAELHRLAGTNARALESPVFMYGFYDMTQVQADFVSEMARHTALTLFVPHGEDAVTWRFGDWFRSTFAPSVTTETRHVTTAASAPQLEIHNACGERDEIWFVAKEVRKLLDDGCPPEEIAVVARTLEAYIGHVDSVFAEHAIAYQSPLGTPLVDHPLAQATLLLFRTNLEEFPRAHVLDVVRHPRFRARAPRWSWELLVRSLRITRGDHWRRLDRYRDSGYRVGGPSRGTNRHDTVVPAEEVAALCDAVRKLMDHPLPASGRWADLAAAHAAFLDVCFHTEELSAEEVPVLDGVRSILASVGRLDATCGSVTRRRFVEAFERELTRQPLERQTAGGVAVLDAMTSRGLSFRHLFLVGLNARVFPRFIVEEPFISDAVRREVFRVLGHHIAVRMDGYSEERLLFHLVRQAATERLVCVYQRTDSRGRLRDPSPFLRPLLARDETTVHAVPHGGLPREEDTRDLVSTPRETILCAANVEEALLAFGYDAGRYVRGEAFVRSLDESLEIGPAEGHTGPLADDWRQREQRGFSPSELEVFGRCPFRYFAERILELRSPEDPIQDGDLTPREMGRLLHALLEQLYRVLASHHFDVEALPAALEVAVTEASRVFEEQEGLLLDGLLAIRLQQIVRAVRAFADWDLRNLGPWTPTWFEERASTGFAGIRVRAVVDRIDRHRDSGALRIVDYKRRFSADWSIRLDTQARRGRKLQAPLYMEVAPIVAARQDHPGAVAVEAIFHFIEGYLAHDTSVDQIHDRLLACRMTEAAWAAAREDVGQTLTTFTGLIREGWFFPRPDDRYGGHCSWCDFGDVCRKGYPGLRQKIRPDRSPALQPYWEVVQGRSRSGGSGSE